MRLYFYYTKKSLKHRSTYRNQRLLSLLGFSGVFLYRGISVKTILILLQKRFEKFSSGEIQDFSLLLSGLALFKTV